MAIKVAINGFGRIGRAVVRAVRDRDDIEIIAINDLADNKSLAHLLKYDSVMGRYPGTVDVWEDGLVIDGKKVIVYEQGNPAMIYWPEGTWCVIESTGRFRDPAWATHHLRSNAKKVVISAPGKKANPKTANGLVAKARKWTEPSSWASTTSCTIPSTMTSFPMLPVRPTAWPRWPRFSTSSSGSKKGI